MHWYFSPECRAAVMWPTWTRPPCCRVTSNSSNSARRSRRCSANSIAPASAGTVRIRYVRSFDRDLEQHRRIRREYLEQRGIEVLAAFDADGLDALGGGEAAKIEMRQPHPGQRLDIEVTAEFFERAVAAVVDDDEGDGQLEFGGAPESLNRVHGGSIAEQPDHLAARPRQCHTHRRGQPGAESAAGAGVEGFALEDGQVIVHRSAAARRFLDDDAVSRTQRGDLL